MDFPKVKLGHFQKKSGFFWIEFYIKFKHDKHDDLFRDKENDNLLREKLYMKTALVHNAD